MSAALQAPSLRPTASGGPSVSAETANPVLRHVLGLINHGAALVSHAYPKHRDVVTTIVTVATTTIPLFARKGGAT